jgi:hypothetical protein
MSEYSSDLFYDKDMKEESFNGLDSFDLDISGPYLLSGSFGIFDEKAEESLSQPIFSNDCAISSPDSPSIFLKLNSEKEESFILQPLNFYGDKSEE